MNFPVNSAQNIEIPAPLASSLWGQPLELKLVFTEGPFPLAITLFHHLMPNFYGKGKHGHVTDCNGRRTAAGDREGDGWKSGGHLDNSTRKVAEHCYGQKNKGTTNQFVLLSSVNITQTKQELFEISSVSDIVFINKIESLCYRGSLESSPYNSSVLKFFRVFSTFRVNVLQQRSLS